jgi:hypothetical protein
MTNRSSRLTDGQRTCFVSLLDDVPMYQGSRWNEANTGPGMTCPTIQAKSNVKRTSKQIAWLQFRLAFEIRAICVGSPAGAFLSRA